MVTHPHDSATPKPRIPVPASALPALTYADLARMAAELLPGIPASAITFDIEGDVL